MGSNEALLRALRPWFDWRSYRSLVLLFAVSMTVFLLPLAYDVGIAVLFRIPAWFRNSLGQAILLALMAVGLRRIWDVRPGDAWPSRPDQNDRPAVTTTARWLPWALRLMVAATVFPLMQNPDGLDSPTGISCSTSSRRCGGRFCSGVSFPWSNS